MTTSQKNLMIRVIKKRMAAGETFDEIIADYPKLTDAEVEELREAVGAQ
jgi:uncharacterized protein (DUF433 family)